MIKSKFSNKLLIPVILGVIFSFLFVGKSAWAGLTIGDKFVAPPPVGKTVNNGADGTACKPLRILQAAIGNLGSGNILRVAEGLYEPADSFFRIEGPMHQGVEVRGGYPLTQGTCSSSSFTCSNVPCPCEVDADCTLPDYSDASRNPVLNTTTLQGNSPVLVLDDVSGVTITGLTIQNGLAEDGTDECENESGEAITAGGGIRVEDSTGIDLTDLIISTNESEGAGGGLAICQSTGVEVTIGPFDVCRIQGNFAEGSDDLPDSDDVGGGGVFVWESTDIGIHDCIIRGNRANGKDEDTDGDGGGVYILSSVVDMDRDLIDANRADDGGGLYVKDSSLPDVLGVDIGDTDIIGNVAEGSGDGGGLACRNSFIQYSRGSIVENQSEGGDGGGAWCNDCQSCIFYGTLIAGNTADDDGGGVYGEDDTTIRLEGARVNDNNAREEDGGGLHVTNDSRANICPVIFGPNDADIFPATINNNSAGGSGNTLVFGRGGGIYADNGAEVRIQNAFTMPTGCTGDLGSPPSDPRARTQIIGNTANGGVTGCPAGLLPGTGSGGGLFIGGGAHLIAVDVDIDENQACGDGGGIAFDNSTLFNIIPPIAIDLSNILRASISKNRSFNPGGGVSIGNACCPAGLENCDNFPICPGAKVTIQNSDINLNSSESDFLTDFPCGGGAIAIGNRGILSATIPISDVLLEQNCIANNTAGGDILSANGGGVCAIKGADVIINHNTITGNRANSLGGGVFISGDDTTVDILNSIVRFNDAPTLINFPPPLLSTFGLEGRDIWCGDIQPFPIFDPQLILQNTMVGPVTRIAPAIPVGLPPVDMFIDEECIFAINVGNVFGGDPFFIAPFADPPNLGLRMFSVAVTDKAGAFPLGTDKEGNPCECFFPGGCNVGPALTCDMGARELVDVPCAETCHLNECIFTQVCMAVRCEDTADAQGMVDCNDPDCIPDSRCMEGPNFVNNGINSCSDGINNNPLTNDTTDCDDPGCDGSLICNPLPTPTATAAPTPTATATAAPTPTATATAAPTATATAPPVTPTQTPDGGDTITVDGITLITNAGTFDFAVPVDVPPNCPNFVSGNSVEYVGFVEFKVSGLALGQTIQVTWEFPFSIAEQVDDFFKSNDTCESYPGATLIPGGSIVATYTDGGQGDLDGVVNGMITDPGSAVIISGDGGGGCAIAQTVRTNSAMINLLIPLIPVLAVGYRVLRRRVNKKK